MSLKEMVAAAVAGEFAKIFGKEDKTQSGAQATGKAAEGESQGAITAEIQTAIKEAVAAETEKLKKDLEKAQGDLATANTKLSETEGKVKTLEGEKTTLEARLKDPKGEAGKQAAEICAGLHVAPVKTEADATAKAGETAEALLEQYNAITDYREKGKFYATHKDKLLKAPAGKLAAK